MTAFDRTTRLTPDADRAGRSSIELDESWSSLRGVHGGYLTALAVRAVEAVLDDRAIRTVAMSFLRPTNPGPATLDVVEARSSRSFGTYEVTVSQGDRIGAVARITAASPVEAASWDNSEPVDLLPPELSIPLEPPEGIRHFGHAEALLDPTHLPFTHAAVARVGGHVRPLERREIDAPWLAMILDWFPPSPFTKVDPPTGGVSIDYTVHLHRTLPRLRDGQWLGARFRADVSAGGIALEHGAIVDPEGRLLAESFHTRWTG
jgi:acyl-CoA thioesterase